ncbi:M23 family metallopeptidase [Erwinia aphidicola]|uniref:M23 family metallopeptidase n=1 Tax=Erwinia aphidicola TaxID=68334 RepID=UPI00300D9590
MIISPPMLRDKNYGESDIDWVMRMIPIDPQRNYPINTHQSWHGGVHLRHADSGPRPEYIRAIADGTVVSFRPSNLDKRDKPPLNYNGGSDCGYVLLKHETETGSGEQGKVTFYSLYMHVKDISDAMQKNDRIYRKAPLGTVGRVDARNGVHFQIFCDDANLQKLVGRATPELDISHDGRRDVVYGDIHFYLPPGTRFYPSRPDNNAPQLREDAVYQSEQPLYVTMAFEQGNGSMTTRCKVPAPGVGYAEVGETLVNADVDDNDGGYESLLYDLAKKLYPDNPSAGYELLRFGRIIHPDRETLMPDNAPLWRTVNYPGGRGWVNLAAAEIRKFSDADFPHWLGWILIDDDPDDNSQWNSPSLFAMNGEDLSRTICHFPFEWNEDSVETRYSWLKSQEIATSIARRQAEHRAQTTDSGEQSDTSWHSSRLEEFDKPVTALSVWEQAASQVVLAEDDWDKLIAHARALCFNSTACGLPAGRVWHFEPRQFIAHFRRCSWLSKAEFKQTIPSYAMRLVGKIYHWEPVHLNEGDGSVFSLHYQQLNIAMRKYGINTPWRMACFLGNACQETQWFSTTAEGYRYSRKSALSGQTEYYNAWYYPWHGRGFLQLTNPDNYFSYFSFRGYHYPQAIRNTLVAAYRRIANNRALRDGDTSLYDENQPELSTEIIGWREQVNTGSYQPADSAGFYWVKAGMAAYADQEHVLERQLISTIRGSKVYYRSLAFWRASAAVNLPTKVDRIDYSGLNGFDARCCAYGNALSVLTEIRFPDSENHCTVENPESNQLRRNK